MKKFAIVLSVFTLTLSQLVWADISQTAKQLFANRSAGSETIARARQLFEGSLSSSDQREKIAAVEYLGKLAYYEGDILNANNSSKQEKIFSKCLDYVEHIKPELVGKTGAYYYWKGTCLAMWGRAAGMLAAAFRIGELKSVMREGLAYDSRYMGGGMHRVIAGVKLNASFLSGLQDRQGALNHINHAVSKGPYFYNAFLLKAQILKKLNKTNEAMQVLEKAKSELSAMKRRNQLPRGFEPESLAFLERIKKEMRN